MVNWYRPYYNTKAVQDKTQTAIALMMMITGSFLFLGSFIVRNDTCFCQSVIP
jgi:hypothetical protein